MNFNGQDVQLAVSMMTNAAISRKYELQKFATSKDERDSDKDGNDSSPIINTFLDCDGTETFISLEIVSSSYAIKYNRL